MWRYSFVVRLLVCFTLCNVGNARVIETATAVEKYSTTTMKTLKVTVKSNSSVSSTTGKSLALGNTTESLDLSSNSKLLKIRTNASSGNITALLNGTSVTFHKTTELINVTKSENISQSLNETNGSTNETVSTIAGNKILDLAFVMDTTGSMGSYINSARDNIRILVDEIAINSDTDLRVALIEYRDHPPQEKTFVTRKNDFTKSVKLMKKWLSKAQASGGGDGPEAVAEGLYEVTKLSWRPEAAKITVLISDAPPHGLAPWKDRTFKEGSPNGHDPIKIAQDLAKREITVYSVGCEPSIDPYKDFFMALAYITSGQYIPLSDPRRLIQAIIGGAQEELSLQKFSKDVEQEVNRIAEMGGVFDEANITKSVYEKLQLNGATSKQLLRNNKPLEGASPLAKEFASFASMNDVRKAYKNERKSAPRDFHRSLIKSVPRMSEMTESVYSAGYAKSPHISSSLTDSRAGPSLSLSSGAGESYSTVDSAVSYEQIARLVRKKTAKLSTV